MSGLTRTVSGIFCIEDSVSLEELESMPKEERIAELLPMDHPFRAFWLYGLIKEQKILLTADQ